MCSIEKIERRSNMKKYTLKNLLPLGSIVTLKHGKKRIMIIGRVQEHAQSKKIYDYSAVYYPEGLIDVKELFLFQQEDIEQVFFIGMQDMEEFTFRTYLETTLKKQGLVEI